MNNTLDMALIEAAITFGREQVLTEISLPRSTQKLVQDSFNTAKINLHNAAIDAGYTIEFNGNEFKAIKSLEGKNDKEN